MRAAAVISISLLGLVIAACAVLQRSDAPVRPDGPHFDHAGHLERGVECSNCHGEEDEKWLAMPPLEFCMECHEEIDAEAEPEKRAAVFYDESGQGRWVGAGKLDSEIIFSHEAHVGRDDDCLRCHGTVARSKMITYGARVGKPECMSCHEASEKASTDCATCHEVIRKDVAPPSHRLGWRTEHGRLARMGHFESMPADCAQCHTRSSCQECHQAEKPRSHNNLWRLHGHAAMASIDREGCEVCHTTDSCAACHADTRPRNHRGTFGTPFNRHCVTCHLPVEGFGDQGCAVCHRGAPSHDLAPIRPPNPVHMTMDPAACRECHTPLEHPDNGQTCLFCHR